VVIGLSDNICTYSVICFFKQTSVCQDGADDDERIFGGYVFCFQVLPQQSSATDRPFFSAQEV